MSTFIDFDLRIRKAGDGYEVTAEATKADGKRTGQAGPEALDWATLSDADFVEKVRRIREEPRSIKQADYAQVGDVLFTALFQKQILRLFTGLYDNDVEPSSDAAMRLRLDIDERAPQVAVLPWEFLYWQGKQMYLATSAKTLLTRQLLNLDYGSIKPFDIKGTPNVLLVIPRVGNLDTATERKIVVEALSKAGITPKVLPEEEGGRVDVQMVSDELANGTYHILHFIGHGEFKEDYDGTFYGSLRFNPRNPIDEKDDESWVTHSQLQALFGPYADDLKLVVLNACKGSEIAIESGKGFIGTAPAILKAGIPAVLAMQYKIKDDVAINFAQTFYNRLTAGRWAGQVDAALTLARNSCFLNFPDDRGFATPILYLRSEDGIIFTGLPGKNGEVATPTTSSTSVQQSGNCPPPPQPPDEMLHDYRYDSVDSLITSLGSLAERRGLTSKQIDYYEKLKVDNPLLAAGGMADLQIEKLKQQRGEIDREGEEKRAVLAWRLHEACLERESLQAELETKKAELKRLEEANQYVPFELKNAITELRGKVRELDDAMRKGKDVMG
ncbi:MAG: CHAT domain-containing protein [Caldilineales bacterium]|nr:CHAT domain-containing protein [Caldilineales bacterium]